MNVLEAGVDVEVVGGYKGLDTSPRTHTGS